jgi:ribosomal protein L34
MNTGFGVAKYVKRASGFRIRASQHQSRGILTARR